MAAPKAGGTLLLAVIFCIALNMRPALSSVATAIDQIAAAFGLGNAAIGLLTMLPPLCFGIAGIVIARHGRNWDVDRTLTTSLLVLCAGLAMRAIPFLSLTYLGTVLASLGIGMVGICLPVVIKREFSFSVGVATGIYTMAMCMGGAIAAAITRPLQTHFDVSWNASLGAWAIPALLGVIAWWLFVMRGKQDAAPMPERAAGNLWRNRLAWHITCFMGFQAGLAFVVFGWLPALLQDRGLDPVAAGYVTSLSILGQWFTALAVPSVAARMRSQRLMVFLCLAATAAGITGILLASPTEAAWWGLLLGLGQGGCFGLALVFIGLRSANVATAMALSGMSQGVGYIIAAAAPMLTGLVRQWTPDLRAQLVLFLAMLLIALYSGWHAGRGGEGSRIG